MLRVIGKKWENAKMFRRSIVVKTEVMWVKDAASEWVRISRQRSELPIKVQSEYKLCVLIRMALPIGVFSSSKAFRKASLSVPPVENAPATACSKFLLSLIVESAHIVEGLTPPHCIMKKDQSLQN